MATAGPITRFRHLQPARRRLLLRAMMLLTGASAAVWLMPFRRAIRFGRVSAKPESDIAVDDCVWAVQAAARRLPWRTMCIEQGLTLQRMLRRGGRDAVLHYGARNESETGKLEAHVWVTLDGRAVIGGEEAAHFVEVATFP